MATKKKTSDDVPEKVRLNCDVHEELRALVVETAKKENATLNEVVARILAAHYNRPDLAEIPRKKIGRPFQEE